MANWMDKAMDDLRPWIGRVRIVVANWDRVSVTSPVCGV